MASLIFYFKHAEKANMVTPLARYLARSPRYILQPADNTLIRFSGPHLAPWEEGTEIQNVSLSGLAFTAPPDLCPLLGEMIKIQFEAPGQSQMACFALVSRLDRQGATTLVGVKFMQLEFPQRIYLAQALSKQFKTQAQEKWNAKPWLIRKSLWISLWITLSLWITANWLWISGTWREFLHWP